MASIETTSTAVGNGDTAGERLIGFDVARALAIMGMVVVHFAIVMAADREHPAWLANVLKFLDGRPAATFMILAGIGVTLMCRRAVQQKDERAIADKRKTLVYRGLILLVLGYLNLMFWQGDILRVYGVSMIIAAAMFNRSSRSILVTSCLFFAGFYVLFVLLDYEKYWTWEDLTYRALWSMDGIARHLFYDGFRSVFPWTGLFLLGMWLGRLDWRQSNLVWRLLLICGGMALLVEMFSSACVGYFRANPQGMDPETIKAIFGTESMPPFPLFLLAAIGEAIALIAACVLVVNAIPRAASYPLAATGQMALTWYLVHIYFGVLAIFLLGLQASQPLPIACAYGIAFFVPAVILSSLWKLVFRQGPLEWIMRKLAG